MEAFGRIDVPVNNAGITKFAGHADLDALTAADFVRLIDVDPVGTCQLVRASLAELKARHGTGELLTVDGGFHLSVGPAGFR